MFLNSKVLLLLLIILLLLFDDKFIVLFLLSLSEESLILLFLLKAVEFICLFVSEEKLKRALFILFELSCCALFNLLSGDISILFNK